MADDIIITIAMNVFFIRRPLQDAKYIIVEQCNCTTSMREPQDNYQKILFNFFVVENCFVKFHKEKMKEKISSYGELIFIKDTLKVINLKIFRQIVKIYCRSYSCCV